MLYVGGILMQEESLLNPENRSVNLSVKECLNVVSSLNDNPLDRRYACKLFSQICCNDSYLTCTKYLLSKRFVCASDLSFGLIRVIFTTTSWGFDYILNNLDEIVQCDSKFSLYNKVENLAKFFVDATKDDEKKFWFVFRKVLKSSNSLLRTFFITHAIRVGLAIDQSFILASLYDNPDDFFYVQETLSGFKMEPKMLKSQLPYYFSMVADCKNIMLLQKYFSLFFEVEERKKMRLLSNFKFDNPDLLKQYEVLLRLWSASLEKDAMDLILSSIVNAHAEKYIIDYVGEQTVTYEDKGTLAYAFKIGNDKIIKFSRGKYTENCNFKSFLFAPTEQKIIKTNLYPIYIERQPYLEKSYQGVSITTDDVRNFLFEIEKQGFTLHDPLCLDYRFDNFGFLNSPYDALINDHITYEELPEWFKSRPLVLYDIDMLTLKP